MLFQTAYQEGSDASSGERTRALPMAGGGPPSSGPPRERSPERSSEEEAVLAALGTVIDPEVGLDLVTMGMVYDVVVADGRARVVYTLTIQGCPMEGHITAGIRAAAERVPGIDSVETELVWDPPWHPGMIQEGAL